MSETWPGWVASVREVVRRLQPANPELASVPSTPYWGASLQELVADALNGETVLQYQAFLGHVGVPIDPLQGATASARRSPVASSDGEHEDGLAMSVASASGAAETRGDGARKRRRQ